LHWPEHPLELSAGIRGFADQLVEWFGSEKVGKRHILIRSKTAHHRDGGCLHARKQTPNPHTTQSFFDPKLGGGAGQNSSLREFRQIRLFPLTPLLSVGSVSALTEGRLNPLGNHPYRAQPLTKFTDSLIAD